MLDFGGNLFYPPVSYLKAVPKEHRGEQPQPCEPKLDWDLPVPGLVPRVTSSPAQVSGTAHADRGCSGCGFAVSALKYKFSNPPPQKSPSFTHLPKPEPTVLWFPLQELIMPLSCINYCRRNMSHEFGPQQAQGL